MTTQALATTFVLFVALVPSSAAQMRVGIHAEVGEQDPDICTGPLETGVAYPGLTKVVQPVTSWGVQVGVKVWAPTSSPTNSPWLGASFFAGICDLLGAILECVKDKPPQECTNDLRECVVGMLVCPPDESEDSVPAAEGPGESSAPGQGNSTAPPDNGTSASGG